MTSDSSLLHVLPTGSPPLSLWEQREQDCLAQMYLWELEGGGGGGSGLGSAEVEQDEIRCPVSWDQVYCWPPAPAGALAVARCIEELNGVFYDTTQNATRWCFPNGTWENYSDYTQCKEIVQQHGDASMTMAFFFGGFCLSLFALSVAIWIFLYFKDLRCLRNTIHTNLMWTYIFYDATWILNACVQGYAGDLVSCALLVVLIHYFYLTNFFWMFVEGLYLFMLVVATFTSEKIKLRVYLIIGWGVPGAIVVTWAVTKSVVHRTAAETTGDPKEEGLLKSHCHLLAPDHFDWIHQAPVITVLAMNLVFLASIMWVLITKLRSANTAETQQYRKATKAMLVLFPLLGITYILMMQGPKEGAAGAVFLNARALLVGLQGFTVALFYCFLNTEVQNTLRHRVERWKEARALGGGRRYTLSGHSKDWSPRSRTESIRLGDLPYGGGLLSAHTGGGSVGGGTPSFHKRESTASATTTTTLLLGGGGSGGNAGSNGRLPNGGAASGATTVRAAACPLLPPGGEDSV